MFFFLVWYEVNKGALSASGYSSREELMKAQERAYHQIDSEDIPDQFAAEILKAKFPELLGLQMAA